MSESKNHENGKVSKEQFAAQGYAGGYAYLDSYGFLHYTDDKPRAGRDGRIPKGKKLDGQKGYAGRLIDGEGFAVLPRFNRATKEVEPANAAFEELALEVARLEGWI
jgi:hypothetical protein